MKREIAEQKLNIFMTNVRNKITEPEVIVEKVILFGSMLTDKPDPNDIDIAIKLNVVDLDPQPGYHLSLPSMIKLCNNALIKLKNRMRGFSFHEIGELESLDQTRLRTKILYSIGD